MPTLFLNYSRKEATLAEQLEAALREHGHTVGAIAKAFVAASTGPKPRSRKRNCWRNSKRCLGIALAEEASSSA